jgi:L,D-transpeptidase ErfK/SrfK
LALLFALPGVLPAATIVGGDTVYTVQRGDTLHLISAKLGVSVTSIEKANQIDPAQRLRVGQHLKVNTRKIVPKMREDGIVINIPDRTLYYFQNGKVESSFPVGLGMPEWRGLETWRTPEGSFRITGKEKDPTWFVPRSLQWKMEQEEKDVLVSVAPGPENPLGRYALKTSLPGILIHETIWPGSIYRFRSHGCVRVAPEYMEPFYLKVPRGVEGEIIYVPIKAALTDEGRVYLEVHRDIYRKIRDSQVEVRAVLERLNVPNKVNWRKVEAVLKEKAGVAEDVTL